jgi:gliding motility-associated-like protein
VILDATWKGASYLWNTGSQDSAIFVNEPNNYVVTITEGDCNEVEQVNVVFEADPCDSLSLCKFEIPNVFTPNSDGLNDGLSVSNLCTDSPFEIFIYNRWGSLVYSAMARQRMIWDGFINGKPASDGTYFVQITYNLGGVAKNAKGSFQLLR